MTRTINTPNGLITCTIEGGVLTLAGPTGTHRVTVDERTNTEAHVAGFVAANGGTPRAVSTGIHYGDIGPMNTDNPYGDGRQGETLQPVTLNGEHVGNLARCYSADTGEDLRLVFYDWRPLHPAHDFDDGDDCVCDYRSARAALAAKKAQIAAALGA
jgi:hypothetical protein